MRHNYAVSLQNLAVRTTNRDGIRHTEMPGFYAERLCLQTFSSGAAAARDLGISRSQITRYEKGERRETLFYVMWLMLRFVEMHPQGIEEMNSAQLQEHFLSQVALLYRDRGFEQRPTDWEALTTLVATWRAEVAERSRIGKGSPTLKSAQRTALLGVANKVVVDVGHKVVQGESSEIDPLLLLHTDLWQDAPDTSIFYGRTQNLAALEDWLYDPQCRLVLVLGLGGVGKTYLATQVARDVAPQFDRVIWRSVLNGRPLYDLMGDWLRILSDQQLSSIPSSEDDCIKLLLIYLQKQRCLLIVDNLETLLEPGSLEGKFASRHAGYGRLLDVLATRAHKSCLLMTSRAIPGDLEHLLGDTMPARVMPLGSMDVRSVRDLLEFRDLRGSDDCWTDLVARFSGNPFALSIVGAVISRDYESDVSRYLQSHGIQINKVEELLVHQFASLHPVEREVLYWLAINREVCSTSAIVADRVVLNAKPFGSQADILQSLSASSWREINSAIASLRNRDMVITNSHGIYMQNVMMEFVTDQLVKLLTSAIVTEQPAALNLYPMLKAQAKEYIRETQDRLILSPVAGNLTSISTSETVDLFQAARRTFEGSLSGQHGYLGANIFHLARKLGINLEDLQISGLPLRQAYLRGTTLQDLDLRNTTFDSCVFTEELSWAMAAVYSPDGRLLATSAGDIRIWDAHNYTQLRVLQGQKNGIRSLAFSPDGSQLVSVAHDFTTRIWDVESGGVISTLSVSESGAFSVAYSPDGEWFVTVGHDCLGKIWDVGTLECRVVLRGHTGPLNMVAVSSRSLIATVGIDCTIRIWDPQTGEECAKLPQQEDWTISIAFNADGSLLASSTENGIIRLWDTSTWRKVSEIHAHKSRIWSLAWHPRGSILVSGSNDTTIRLWDITTGKCLRTLYGHTNQVWCVRFAPDGDLLASASDDFTVRIWDVETGQCIKRIEGYHSSISAIAINAAGNLTAIADHQNRIVITDTATGDIEAQLEGHTNWIPSMQFLPSGNKLISGSADKTVRIWDIKQKRPVSSFERNTDWVYTTVMSPDESTVASGGFDRTLWLWKPELNEVRAFRQEYVVRALAWAPEGSHVIVGGQDPALRVINASTGVEERQLLGHTNSVRYLAFTHKGKLLASSSRDTTIRFWDWPSGECISVLEADEIAVTFLSFNWSDDLLASGGLDRKVRIWDVATRKCIHVLSGHEEAATALAWLPDGTTLLSSSDDGTIRIWDAKSGLCLETRRLDRPYERLNIAGATGLTESQRNTMKMLGAVESS